MRVRSLLALCGLLVSASLHSAEIDKKYPLDTQLRILAEDVKSSSYRELVTKVMILTDLAAEWQRVATKDNAEAFLEKHGGKEKVFADLDLRKAYERRVAIRNEFLELMREGYRKHKKVPPFDQGEKAEAAGTIIRKLVGPKRALSTVLPAPGSERQWPRFRGPSGQGWTGRSSLPIHWDKNGTNIVWRVKVPGQGNSSPIVWDERIFLTGWNERGRERFIYCFHRDDGRLLWMKQVPDHNPEPGVRHKNGYASATPVTDGERVIAFLGSCGLVCYDVAGNFQWNYDELRVWTTHGPGSSPLLYKDMVLFIHDQTKADSLFVALDKRTGKLLWTQPRPKSATWSSPVIVRVGDHDELVFAGAKTVKGYDPSTGKELWTLDGPTQEVVPTIVIGADLIYSASGRNGPIIGLRPGGTGNVSQTHVAWQTVRGGAHVPSPILVGDRLFAVNDTGVAACYEAGTGTLLWQERLPDRFSASPIEAGGLLYIPSERGITYVLRAADQFELVARNDLGEPILASAAVAGERMILRTLEELVCIGTK